MDETIRVKIVADTKSANTSLKQLSRETNNLGIGGNQASEALEGINRVLRSIGFRNIQLNAVTSRIKWIGEDSKKAVTHIKEFGKSLKTAFGNISNLGNADKIKANFSPITRENLSEVQGDIQNLREGSMDCLESLVELRSSLARLSESGNILFKTKSFGNFKQYINETIENIDRVPPSIDMIEKKWKKVFDGMESKLVRIGNLFKNFAAGLLKGLGKVLGFLGKGLIVGALAGAVLAIKNAFSVSKLGNDIDKTSQKVGMSTKEFQRWSYILQRCGVDVSNLKTAMRSLTATSMNKQNSSYFKQLGINPDELSQEKLFETTVTQLQKVEDRTVRAQMAYKLFGRASAELAPVLALNVAEIQRLSYQYELLGARMNGSVIRASVNLTDALQDMRAAWQGLKNTLAQGILPIITNIIVKITVLIAKINMILQALFDVDDAAAGVTDRTQTITKNTQATAAAVKKLKTLIAGFDELNIFPSQDNPNGDIGSFLDDLEDYGNFGGIEPGQILPEWAIKDLENFRDNILPGIIEKIEKLRDDLKTINGILKGTEIADEDWEVAFDVITAPVRAAIDLVKQLADGLGALLSGEGLKGLWEEWFSIDGLELPDTGWLAAWWDAVINGTDETMGIRDIPGLREIYNFFDWLLNFDTLNLSDVFDFDWLGEIKDFEAPTSFIEFVDQLFGIDIDWDRGIWKHLMDFANWLDGIDWGKLFEDLKKNINPSYWWNGDENTIGLKEMLGFDKIEGWDIWKKEWWQNLFKKGPESGSSLGIGSVTKGIEDGWNSVKQWWNTNVSPKFTASFWQGKFQTASIGLVGVNIPAKIAEVWLKITTWWKTSVAPKFTASYWQNKFQSIKDGLANTPIFQKAREAWEFLKGWWDTSVAPIFTRSYWQNKWNSIKEGLSYSSIKTGAIEKWNSLKSWWNSDVAPKFTWTFWRDKFNSIKTGLQNIDLSNVAKKIMNGFLTAVENGINKAIDAINNSGIGRFLNINLSKVYIPKFNTYAKGGVISEPTFGIMGEYPGARSNPEIVTPENKLTEIFQNSNDDIVSVLVQGFRQIIQAIDEKDTSISIGDTTIAKAAARGNQQYRLQTGTSLF